MAKGQKKSNKEIRKPKKEKVRPTPRNRAEGGRGQGLENMKNG